MAVASQERFDEIARDLATDRISRGRVLRMFAATVLGTALAGGGVLLGAGEAEAACRLNGQRCRTNTDCCPGARCTRTGVCVCREGRTVCGGRCPDIDNSTNHCGECFNACSSNEVCQSGECCRPSFTLCTDVCSAGSDCAACCSGFSFTDNTCCDSWLKKPGSSGLEGFGGTITALLLVGRLALALVFAVAGITKLADRPGSRQAIIDFGLPSSLAAPLSLLLPLAELVVAAALIPTSTALWGALGALALLLLFVAGIGANLAQGKKPDCRCFGQLHSAPAGWKTLARNGVLAAVAGFVVWQGWEGNVGPSAIAWLGAPSVVQLLSLVGGVVALGLLAGQWWFLLHLLRQNGRLLVRIEALEAGHASGAALQPSPNGVHQAHPPEGLPVGSEAPEFGLPGLYGEALTLGSLRAAEKPVMLLFTDPGCGPCTAMLPEIGRWQEEHAEKLTISFISRGDPEENRTKAQEHGLTNVLLQGNWEVSETYQVAGTPSAVLVRADGTIGSQVAGGAEGIRALLAYAVGERAQLPMNPQPTAQEGQPCPNCGKVHATAPTVPAAREIGEPAPEVKLPDLEGNTVRLADFHGEETLVLFWNPGCGFCQQMLPDIKEWEANLPEGVPKLLFVSAGTEEANREMGLSSTVVLDQEFAIGRAFGASGTPSAVLVDAEGRIGSEVAIGAPAVLELARSGRTAA